MSADRLARLPRVLFAAEIDPSQKYGSFEEQTLSLGRAFRENSGVFIPLFSRGLGHEAGEDYRAHGLQAECLDLGRFRLATLMELARLVRRERIEVIHWNFYEPIRNGYVWGLSLLTPTVRHFFTDHTSRPSAPAGSPSRVKGALKRLTFRRYETVFCVSDFVAESLRSGLRWRNVARWTHLVNTERFSPDPAARRELRERYGAGDRFVAVVVAHLTPEKGVDVAIRAFAELPGEAELWVVGGGREREGLEGLARELVPGDRVRFFGARRDVAPFMRAADCMICPSLWAEAAGLVNIEALACGLPVVASRIGGIPEHVDDGRTGVLFTPGDHRELARALASLMGDRDALIAMGSAARAAALDRFSIQNRMDMYLDYYRPAAGGSRHAEVVHATA
jgi:glycosyltransferase involved in cell wall biosynthesis